MVTKLTQSCDASPAKQLGTRTGSVIARNHCRYRHECVFCYGKMSGLQVTEKWIEIYGNEGM